MCVTVELSIAFLNWSNVPAVVHVVVAKTVIVKPNIIAATTINASNLVLYNVLFMMVPFSLLEFYTLLYYNYDKKSVAVATQNEIVIGGYFDDF